MKNFLLGALVCYLMFTPKAQAGVNSDIQSIVSSLAKIASSVSHIETMLASHKQCKPSAQR